MGKQFTGRTVDADAPFLGAAFWTDGKSVTGIVSKIFDTEVERKGQLVKAKALQLLLNEPVEVDGEEWDRVSVGNLAGIKMAIDVAKDENGRPLGGGIILKDIVTLTCESRKKAKKPDYSDRLNFKLELERP